VPPFLAEHSDMLVDASGPRSSRKTKPFDANLYEKDDGRPTCCWSSGPGRSSSARRNHCVRQRIRVVVIAETDRHIGDRREFHG
jgi:hypothetical protein